MFLFKNSMSLGSLSIKYVVFWATETNNLQPCKHHQQLKLISVYMYNIHIYMVCNLDEITGFWVYLQLENNYSKSSEIRKSSQGWCN